MSLRNRGGDFFVTFWTFRLALSRRFADSAGHTFSKPRCEKIANERIGPLPVCGG
jgi:hypothetical protein